MSRASLARPAVAALGVVALGVTLAACSTGGSSDSGKTQIMYVTQNDPTGVANAEKQVALFNESHDDIEVVLTTQPAGAEGDNLTKTKLSTDEMEDVFSYNTGSLLQALNPDQTLVDLSGESWVDTVTEDFQSTVSTDNGMYGAPIGTSFGGGILYNIPLYEELGLEVPETWDDFVANSEKIKAAKPDVTPVLSAYGTDWTSQLLILADFANINAEDPDWAQKYTDNEAKYADPPAIAGFEHLQEIFDKNLLNEDFASLDNDGALNLLATGGGAHYPMLTNAVGAIEQNTPDNIDDVGFFALPAMEAEYTSATIWQPNGLYIPKTTEGAQLDAAKTFVEWLVSSPESCALSKELTSPAGPYVTTACELDPDVPRMVSDVQGYFDSGKTAPALEFLSPIKGPNLPNIAIEVGSGFRSAQDAAALYDEDVKKQAQQLGLEAWN